MTSNGMALARRFFLVGRQEGPVAAMGKALRYLMRAWRGEAATVLPRVTREEQPPIAALNMTWRYLSRNEAFHVHRPQENRGVRKHIVCIGDLGLPQCRKYRVDQLGELWRERGHGFASADYRDLPGAIDLLQTATHLVEYRLPGCAESEVLHYEARRLGLPILYDIDDPLFSIPAYETYGNMAGLGEDRKAAFIRQAPGYLAMMNAADMVSVSTPGLLAHAQQFTTRPVSLRRNFADQETLSCGARAAEMVNKQGFCVAFASGSEGHEADFAEILEPLTTFFLGGPDRWLLIIGKFDRSTLPQPLQNRTEMVPFSHYKEYLSALARAHCVVTPLADDLFNQCKSAARVIDAMAVSVPQIVSNTGDLPTLVEHGHTGLVACSPQDWRAGLTALAENRTRCEGMGRAARRLLESERSGNVLAPELIDWVEHA